MKKLFAFALFAVVCLPTLYAQIKVYDTIRGLNEPMAFVIPNTDTFLVTQRPGQVIKRTPSNIITMYNVPNIFYSNQPNAFSANGLIGICLHPDYKTNKLFYIYYTCMAPNPYLDVPLNPYPYQYPKNNPPGAPANPDELPQITVDMLRDDGNYATFMANIFRWSVPVHMRPANAPYEERYGGNIRIGADSMLYVTIGDIHFTGGYVPAQPSNAQNYFNPAGKILRLKLNGQPVRPPLPPAPTPVANPFWIPAASAWSMNFAVPQWAGNSQFMAECIYAAGFRNAFDFALNPLNNRFVAEENGDLGGDEINDIVAGVNYQYQGPANFLVYPYNNSGPMPGSQIGLGPTGVLVYTGDCISEWKNSLLTASVLNLGYAIKKHTFVDPPNCSQIYANATELAFTNTTITTLMQGTKDDYVYALANNVNFLPYTGCIYRIGKEIPAFNRIIMASKNCPFDLKVCGMYQYPKYNCEDSARLVSAGWCIYRDSAAVACGEIDSNDIDTVKKTYCFLVSDDEIPADTIPGPPKGYDIATYAVFFGPFGYDTVWSSLPDSGFLPGTNNDFFGPCPELICCESCPSGARNLVFNSHFNYGNSGFSTDLDAAAGTVNTGEYTVNGPLGSGWQQGDWSAPADHGGGGNYLITNSSSESETVLWRKTVPVHEYKIYRFCAWVNNLTDTLYDKVDPIISVRVNGNTILRDTISESPDLWLNLRACWASIDTLAEIEIVSEGGDTAGNDLAIDDIAFGLCEDCCEHLIANLFSDSAASEDSCYYTLSFDVGALYPCAGIDHIQLENLGEAGDIFTFNELNLSAGDSFSTPIVRFKGVSECSADSFDLSLFTEDSTFICSFILKPDTLAGTDPEENDSCCSTCATGINNKVFNGNFSLGDTGFYTDLEYVDNFTVGGEYTIDSSTGLVNPAFQCVGKGGTANDLFMVCDVGMSTPILWRQCVTVIPGKYYTFCAWINNLIKPMYDFADPHVAVYINSQIAVPWQMLSESPDEWLLLTACWKADSAITSACLEIRAYPGTNENLNDIYQGNDLAIDDISFGQCAPPSSPFQAGIQSTRNAGKLFIYPNPAKDALHIIWPKEENYTSLTITDMQGRVIKQVSIDAGMNRTQLSVLGLSKGFYFITMKDRNGNQQVEKLLVE